MKQEDKELLLKDLCARLPYGVKVRHEHLSKTGILYEISMYDDITIDYGTYNHFGNINDTKPYLFPISSMTEEQIAQLEFWAFMKEYHKITDFYYENHIDFRGLIEKGLAIDCTNLNIY